MRPLNIFALISLGGSLFLSACHPGPKGRQLTDLSGPGWMLSLDSKAAWENDELFLPPVDLSKVPNHAPIAGWSSIEAGTPVSVPGTVEEYLGKGQGPDFQTKGVSWWTRTFTVPEMTKDGILKLQFEAVRLRAEVYVEGRLVAYDLVGSTPFEADLTPLLRDGTLKSGVQARLAVRVTNPGGNCDWRDTAPIGWGKYLIPSSHAFSGIPGGVKLLATGPVAISDLYLQNTPKKTAINIITTLRNLSGKGSKGIIDVVVRDKATGAKVLARNLTGVSVPTGESTVTCLVEFPEAKLWDPDHPNLYSAKATFRGEGGEADSMTETFGFRWFSPEGIDSDAVLRLNGKRVVVRTAISWGFWPINGLFPSPELAERQVKVAKAYGLNMLNFHRCIGSPVVLDRADELGLLYFEEPGGYLSGWNDPFAQALAREKLLRMVKRDRNHPALVFYNMINEQSEKLLETNTVLFDIHRSDLRDAHAVDPSRTILYTSAWAGRAIDPKNDQAKMHMCPYDGEIYMSGWFDFHRASGPDLWRQEFYNEPAHHYGFTTNTGEIVYWGEEGAVSAPPRLGLIEQELKSAAYLGWDGQVYRDWYAAFDGYITTNNLRAAFPTVDDLCKAMGEVSIEHQGRKIEDTRICDANDGYAINGWESELIENHSGVVDCFRNPKADPAILAYYNQPLYVAVKPRLQVVKPGSQVPVDFYLINEKGLKGSCNLRILANDPSGRKCFTTNLPVNVSGGDVYGQLLAEAVRIPVTVDGFTRIFASLMTSGSPASPSATGHDRVFATECASVGFSTKGAVLENGSAITSFLKERKGINVPVFDNTQSPLDWIVVAKSVLREPGQIPSESLITPEGVQGIKVSFFDAKDPSKPLCSRIDRFPNLKVDGGASPDPRIPLVENYNIVWEGSIIPPESGEYLFRATFRDGARVMLDDRVMMDVPSQRKNQTQDFKVTLKKGKPVSLCIKLFHKDFSASLQLLWQTPVVEKVTPEQVLSRASRDGTTIVIADRSETWLDAVAKASGIAQGGSFSIGGSWLGGQYFAKDHPIFDGLPVNCALNWPYQSIVGGRRTALEVNGGELVSGAYHTWPMKLGSAVSVLPLGKGRVILSSLDVVSQLASPNTTAEVARRLFCNFLHYASPAAK